MTMRRFASARPAIPEPPAASGRGAGALGLRRDGVSRRTARRGCGGAGENRGSWVRGSSRGAAGMAGADHDRAAAERGGPRGGGYHPAQDRGRAATGGGLDADVSDAAGRARDGVAQRSHKVETRGYLIPERAFCRRVFASSPLPRKVTAHEHPRKTHRNCHRRLERHRAGHRPGPARARLEMSLAPHARSRNRRS